MGNLIGEPFKDYVSRQIISRQKVHGKQTRTLQELQYLNSKNAWIKLASGTSMEQRRLDLLSKSGNPLVVGTAPGLDLAVNNVLFNGLSSFGDKARSSTLNKMVESMPGATFGVDKFRQIQREGITGDEYKRAYGVGGTQEYGYSPMPGIIDASIKDLNRGSIKRATLKIKAHNRSQFDVIDALYLRLGYSVLLEWGNDKYLDKLDSNGDGVVENMGTTLADNKFFKYNSATYSEVLPAIENLRKKYKGNYDGMFGVISNFSWTFEPDGSYDIKLELISQGDVVESLKANLPPNEEGAKDSNPGSTQTNVYKKQALKNIMTEPITDIKAFYDDLYPGFEQILKDWYEGAKAGKAKFDVEVDDIPPDIRAEGPEEGAFTFLLGQYKYLGVFADEEISAIQDIIFNQPAFPTLDIKRYTSIEPNNPIKTQQNVGNLYLYGHNLYDVINSIIVKNGEQQKNKDTAFFTGFNSDGTAIPGDNKELQKAFQKSKFKNQDLLFFELSGYIMFLKTIYDGDVQRKKLGALDIAAKDDIARQILINNITFEDLRTGVFEKFVDNNAAGGSEDKQFAQQAEEYEELEDKDKAEIDAEKDLETNKNRSKVHMYFQNIRKVWKDKGSAFNFNDIKFQPSSQEESITIGGIINPVGSKTGPEATLKPIWNEKVGFPIYPRANREQLSGAQLQEQLLLGGTGDIGSDQPNAADIIRMNFDPGKQYFIRFGVFLEYLEQRVIPDIKSGSKKKQPLLKIDYHPMDNICYIIDNIISLDPNKLIIKNQSFYNGTSEFEKIFPQLKTFKRSKGKFLYGNLMNIYFSFNRIEEIFEGVDDKNQISIFKVLKTLATDINESFGGINNIEPVIDKETNTITFIDQTQIPGLKSISKDFKRYSKFDDFEPTLEIFGYNQTKTDNPTSNFVRSAGITTEISKEYATIITIGATANGAIPGAESTAFSKWNIGIQDRFKTNIVDGEAERNENLQQQNKLVLRNYKNMIERQYAKLGLSQGAENLYNINEELIGLNKSVASNYYIYAQTETSNENPNPNAIESSIGFIPFNLKLEMDGLSGIKIYNKVKVNTSFLPSNYGNTLDFIVTGVNHKLSGNEWVTNLDTIATTKSKFAK
jgi:hypothetical protein